MAGRPNSFRKNCELFFGVDRWWWMIPTHPCLRINYLERTFTRVQIQQMFRRKLVDIEPDDEWDPNKKHFLKELKRSNFEKMVYISCLVLMFFVWWLFI